MAWGRKVTEPAIWAEVSSFMLVDQNTSVKALAEYVVLGEKPAEANTYWLMTQISGALKSAPMSEDSPIHLSAVGHRNNVAWVGLLDDNVRVNLETLAHNIESE